jgi:N-acetyl-anhydromuramyl-L-alanine amidase AmpD
MVDVILYGNFKSKVKGKRRKQIVLCHTAREVGEYLTSLRFRNNAKYERIPHFVITKEGKVLELLSPKSETKFFGDNFLDKETIVICLENLGWLTKKPLSSTYLNWIGNIYSEEVYERKWRDYVFWQPYTKEQVEQTASLCIRLCEEFNIPKRFVGHNTKIDGIELFQGIVTRSNYNQRFTDLSPAFDFENFKNLLKDEQLFERKV